MNFLAPWFLLGALAVAGPILFHLIRRSARERMPFSSLLFLRPTPPRATRRPKMEHILLLLLRCVGVLLLAVGFARPFLARSVATPPPASAGRETVILIDTSASMRREGLWPKALEAAKRCLKDAQASDRVAVLSFDQQPRTLISFSEWSAWPLDQRAALAAVRLDSFAPSWFGTQLGLGLTTAAEQFAEGNQAEAAARDVILISDMQEGARLDGLQGHEWPKGVRVVLERVDPDHPSGAGLEILDPAAGADEGRQARVRVVNPRDATQEKLQLTWAAENGTATAGQPEEIYLPPGQTRTFLAPALPTNMATGELRLTGGATAYFVAPETERVTIAYFGSESPNDSSQLRYYLQRAFPNTARRHVEIVTAASNADFSLAVVPGTLTEEAAGRVRSALESGKTVLLTLTNGSAGPTLAALMGNDAELAEATGDFSLLGDIDFTHPIFAPFADPRFSDFSHIHFWKHRHWTIPPQSPARVLAKFDDGSPALALVSVGKGNLLVLTSGWNPADSQLAVSSKFVPLLQTILDWSGGAAPTRSQFQTGEPIPLLAAAGATLTSMDKPGIYSVSNANGVHRFAVNVPLDESRTAPLSPDDFARLGVPLQTKIEVPVVKTAEVKRRALEEELENRQKLWRWLIGGLLTVALVEILLGGRLARRITTMEVTP